MPAANSPPPFIPWDQCVQALDDASLKDFEAWRGFSWEFCLFLRAQRLLGLYQDRSGTSYFCYPVFGPGGIVIAEHVFTQNSDPNAPKAFMTAGAAGNLSPVILGPLPHAKSIFPAESPHDALAFADRSGMWKDPDACFIGTRGASNDKLLSGLPWPKQNGHPDPEVFLLCQNDQTIGPDGLTANERWLRRVTPRLPFAYYRWNPPALHKDFNDWTRSGVTGAELFDQLARLKNSTKPTEPAPSLIEVLTPSEVKAYKPPTGTLLVGDNHIVRGNVFVIGGAPGTGKSRATVALAEAGATRYEWFGLTVHCNFSLIIIQNENGRYRLQQEFAQLDTTLLDRYLRITPPPPHGLCFYKEQFRDQLKRLFETFPPAVVILDPWSAVARDDKQKDYLEGFELVQETIPSGDLAPALGIAAHTRKPKPEDRANRGRNLLNLLSGSLVLGSIPRTVWILQNASDLVTDNRVVVTCCKNNNGQEGDRSVWERGNGLWSPVHGFDWNAFDNPPQPGKKGSAITDQAMGSIFEFGYKGLKLTEAVAALIKLTGLSKSPCYRALDLDNGPFKNRLFYDKKTKLYHWNPN
jgi:AAA domain